MKGGGDVAECFTDANVGAVGGRIDEEPEHVQTREKKT